jgi:hypothetical protein
MAVRMAAGLTAQWFTPESQASEIAPARFLLKPLSTLDRMDMAGILSEKLHGQAADLVLRATLQNWENVMDSEGAPMIFEAGKIGQLPVDILLALTAEAIRRSTFAEGDIKN